MASRLRLFHDDNWRGGEVAIENDVPDLRASGFNDVTSSIRVEGDATWTLYEHINYTGYSVTVNKHGSISGGGFYSTPLSFGGRNDVFSSVRKNADVLVLAEKLTIRLFRHADFLGGEVALSATPHYMFQRSLVDLGFNDVVSSLIVEGGTWVLTEHESGGFSVTVSAHGGPNNDGRYPSPRWLGDRNDVFSQVRKTSEWG